MRIAAFLLVLFFLVSCERGRQDTQSAAPAPTPAAFSTPASDELPGLPAPATGIAFWDHPSLSFNGVMIVASENGVVSYNMEDGNEVSRIDGFNADGVATGYLGFGARAAGFIAFLDATESAFRFYGVDNESRAFLPLDGGPAIRGAVRGFCLGRAKTMAAPSLYVIQKDQIQVFNLAASPGGVALDTEAVIPVPDDLTSCAVDVDGVLVVAAEDGDIFKLTGPDAFSKAFASARAGEPGDLVILRAADEAGDPSADGQIVLFDLETGALHVFDRMSGNALGVVSIDATDVLPGVDRADVFAATAGNLGGLYRDGVAAFGVGDTEGGPVIRLAPVSGVRNALSLPAGAPVSPRGRAPEVEDSGLIIPEITRPE